MSKFLCSNCKTPVEVTPDVKVVVCPGCGKKYRNPKYAEPTPQAELAPAQAPTPTPAPAPAPKPQVPSLACRGCGHPIELTPDLAVLTCPECGKKYKNPNYAAPTQAPAPYAPAPTPTPATESTPAYESAPAYTPAPEAGSAPSYDATPSPDAPAAPAVAPTSKFTGTMISWLGHHLFNMLMLVITLGLAYPWIVCRKYRWKIDRQIIDGHKLKFEGKGGSLFGHWLLWAFLTIITVGIYGLWVPCKIQRWITERTHIDETYVAPQE